MLLAAGAVILGRKGKCLHHMSTAGPAVSVVIPAYNAERFIAEAIDSALSQTRPPLEVIVVDDGSTDGTGRIAQGYGDRIRYHWQANAKQAAARNTGCRLSRGDWLAFLDADDVWERDKLERQLRLVAGDPALGLVYCSAQDIGPEGQPAVVRQAEVRGRPFREVLLGTCGGGLALGSTALVKKNIWERVGGFQEDLSPCEDTDFAWRVATECIVDFVSEPLVRYRQHPGNAHRDVTATTRAWTLLYERALRHPAARSAGWIFRARCRGRLYYMLAGDHARAGRWMSSFGYAMRLAVSWPPGTIRLIRRAFAARARSV